MTRESITDKKNVVKSQDEFNLDYDVKTSVKWAPGHPFRKSSLRKHYPDVDLGHVHIKPSLFLI